MQYVVNCIALDMQTLWKNDFFVITVGIVKHNQRKNKELVNVDYRTLIWKGLEIPIFSACGIYLNTVFLKLL